VAAVEQWAADQGYRRLTLETGAANEGATEFYAALGYQMEQVVLSKAIPAPSPL
jgi:GNAT superfamily N-acetyltransferase